MMMMGLGVTLYCTPVEASAHLFLTGLGTFCGKRPFKETNRNKLVLNTGKTEVKAASASSRLSLVDSNSAEVGVGNISFKTSVKYLGVKTGQPLFMQDPIISVCRASSVELRSLASIRPYLSNSTYARLVTALITSRLVIATQC